MKDRAVVFHRSRAWTDAASRGYELLLEDGKPSFALIHFWPGDAMRIRTKAAIPVGKWVHVAVTYDGSSRASGMQIYIDGKPADCDVVRNHLTRNITGGGGDNIAIGERFRDRGFKNGLVDEFQVFKRELSPVEVAELHQPGSLKVGGAGETDGVFSVGRRCSRRQRTWKRCEQFESSDPSSSIVCRRSR